MSLYIAARLAVMGWILYALYGETAKSLILRKKFDLNEDTL